MTARAQSLPEGDWVGNLVPKLTEKAKSIYLEIPDPACQDYFESKAIIIKAYQLTADHYRYRFRTPDKKPDEEFVQWGNRTRTVPQSLDGRCRGYRGCRKDHRTNNDGATPRCSKP